MMKALLADDHYPVLEFLQHSIPWKELGIEIIGLCHNGSEALECCEQTLPDILVTDIGMPKVDGLALIRQLKERNPKLQTIILSCHDEFQYAQQAVSIGVTAYILKESMQPEEITTQLRNIVDKLQGELTEQQKKLQMQRIVHETHSLYKAEFMRKSLHNPVINEAGWTRELQELGVHIHTTPYMPVLLYPNNAHLLQRRFQNGTLMGYAFDNVIEELIDRARDRRELPVQPAGDAAAISFPEDYQAEPVRGRTWASNLTVECISAAAYSDVSCHVRALLFPGGAA